MRNSTAPKGFSICARHTFTARKQFIARAPVVLTFDKDNFIIDGTIDFRIYPNRITVSAMTQSGIISNTEKTR